MLGISLDIVQALTSSGDQCESNASISWQQSTSTTTLLLPTPCMLYYYHAIYQQRVQYVVLWAFNFFDPAPSGCASRCLFREDLRRPLGSTTRSSFNDYNI